MDDYKKSEEFSDLVHDMSAQAYILGMRKGTEIVKEAFPDVDLTRVPGIVEELEAEEESGGAEDEGVLEEGAGEGGGAGGDTLPLAEVPPADPSLSQLPKSSGAELGDMEEWMDQMRNDLRSEEICLLEVGVESRRPTIPLTTCLRFPARPRTRPPST